MTIDKFRVMIFHAEKRLDRDYKAENFSYLVNCLNLTSVSY